MFSRQFHSAKRNISIVYTRGLHYFRESILQQNLQDFLLSNSHRKYTTLET